jgi:hypothetical protein
MDMVAWCGGVSMVGGLCGYGCRRIEAHVIYCCEKRGSSKFAKGVCLYVLSTHPTLQIVPVDPGKPVRPSCLYLLFQYPRLTQQQWYDARRLEFARSSRPRRR